MLYRRGLSRHELADYDGAVADWSAHLAEYSGEEPSPFLDEIKLRAGRLLNGQLSARPELHENVA